VARGLRRALGDENLLRKGIAAILLRQNFFLFPATAPFLLEVVV
jgi:hypothetical protein